VAAPITNLAESRLRALLDPHRLVRWGYLARLGVAAAIFVAAVYEWQRLSAAATLVATLACMVVLVTTAASAVHTEIRRRPLRPSFLYGHVMVDVALATTVVHLTGGFGSQFVALYILVIVVASLLLPPRGTVLVTGLTLAAFLADGLLIYGGAARVETVVQFGVFAAVAAVGAAVGSRLQELGAGQDELTAELAQFRVHASDILRTIRSGIVTIDGKGRLLYANPAAGSLLGVALARATGRHVLPVVAAASPALAAALARGLESGDRTTRGEGTVTAQGRTFPVGVTTTVSEMRDGGVAVTAIFQDISASKRAEELHRRTERLEAVAALSASLAHEIRNPLASIRSAVEQLATMPQAGEDERTLGALVVRESDRLSRLLGEFLDFARVRVTRVAPLDLGRLAEDAATLVRAHPDRAAAVEVRCVAPPDLVVEGDEDLLHRAVFNLLLNGVQATRAGRVTVEVAPVEQDALPAGLLFDHGAVALRVSDTGGGIPPEVRDRLFDPFITTKAGGTGLGLPMVQRAVESHHGVVLVDGDSAGARFTVLLPVRQVGGLEADGRRASGVGLRESGEVLARYSGELAAATV